ncbi:MAG: hypothetical protein ABIJ47_08095 [Candidatus Bathyarchaeota archaeon]
MSLMEEYGIDDPSVEIPLLILSFHKGDSLNELHIHKITRYFQYIKKKNYVTFSNFRKGDVSYEIQESLEELNSYDLIDKFDENCEITPLGEEVTKEIIKTYDEETIKQLNLAYNRLKNMDDDELMFFMYNLLPESKKNSTQLSRLLKNKIQLTKSLYRKGLISKYTGAKWLEISEKSFDEFVSK